MRTAFIIYARKENVITETGIAQDLREPCTVSPEKKPAHTENAADAGKQEKIVEMEMLEKIIPGVYLLWASWHDIREKGIPIMGLAAGGLIALFYLIPGNPEKGRWMAMFPGIGLYFLAKISDGIGEADGIVLLFMGWICGTSKTLQIGRAHV